MDDVLSVVTGSDDLFTPGEGTLSKMAEVDRLMHLCGGALEGLCSITIREDVRDRSVEALATFESLDPSILRAAYAMADEVDLWDPDSLQRVHEITHPDDRGFTEGAQERLKDLFDRCFMSDLPMTVIAAIAHRGILAARPFGAGTGTVARIWYAQLLGRTDKEFQYVSPETEFLRTRGEYEVFVSDPGDLAGFVDYCLDCDREVLSRLFGSLW